jgi:hypothetical protein
LLLAETQHNPPFTNPRSDVAIHVVGAIGRLAAL